MFNIHFLPYWGVIVAIGLCYSRLQLGVGRMRVPAWAVLGAICSLAALAFGPERGGIGWQGLGWLIILSMTAVLYRFVPYEGPRKRWIKEGAFLLLLVISYQLLCNTLPGFGEAVVFADVILGHSVFGSSLKLHFNQAMVGLILFGVLVTPIRSWKELKTALWYARYAPILLTAVYAIGVMQWLSEDFKFNQYVAWYWLANLFFVCIAEEAFFRVLIQRRLEGYIGGKGNETIYLAAVITAVIYTITHYNPAIPIPEMPLVFLSGLVFGYVYAATRRIELSILCHLFYNGITMMVFVYP